MDERPSQRIYNIEHIYHTYIFLYYCYLQNNKNFKKKSKEIMLRTLLIIAAIAATANAGAVDLNPDNFDSEITSSGKGAFVKFLAPW